MRDDWKLYKLGSLFIRRYDSVVISDLENYKRITIKTKGLGVELRDIVSGLEIGTKNQYKVKKNQFLLSKIDAMNGAFGIVPDICDNGIITGNFWTYDIDNTIIDINYLKLLIKNQIFTSFSIDASEGSTNRKYLREEKFLNLSIPLPLPAEQKRIVEKIENIQTRVEQIRKLRTEQEKEINNLFYSCFKKLIDIYGTTTLGDKIKYKNDFITINDLETYKLCKVQTKAQGVVLRENKIGSDIKTKQQQICKTDDFLVAEMDARFGGYGIVPSELDGAIVSSHYFLYSINNDVLNKRYLDFFSQTIWFHSQVKSKGSTNYAGIRPYQVLDYQIPLPSLPEQNRIVSFLEKVNQIRQTFKAQEAELTDLLPSLLDKAFKGKLFEKKEEKDYMNVYCEYEPLMTIAAEPVSIYHSSSFHKILMVYAVIKANKEIGTLQGEVALFKDLYFTDKILRVNTCYSFAKDNWGTFDPSFKDVINNSQYFERKNYPNSNAVYIEIKDNNELINAIPPEIYEQIKAGIKLMHDKIFRRHKYHKKTEMKELFATVLKCIEDIQCTELTVIRQEMKRWKTPKQDFLDKATKFSEQQTKEALDLIINEGWHLNVMKR